jgi:hypothetical protein
MWQMIERMFGHGKFGAEIPERRAGTDLAEFPP